MRSSVRSTSVIVLAGLVVIGAVALGARVLDARSPGVSDPADWSMVAAALPDGYLGEVSFALTATHGPLGESLERAAYVVIVRVEAELPAQATGELKTLAGTHVFTDRVVEVSVVRDIKGGAPSVLQLKQGLDSLDGQPLVDLNNPPLEIGREYLVFVARDTRSDGLRVVPPSIHMVVDGRLYWVGARGDVALGWPPPEYTRGSGLYGLWGIGVEYAAAEIARSR